MRLQRTCMSDQIRQILQDRIISGVLRPGDRLLELEIAREFNTSQTPVREALESLHTQKLVESIPYRGTYVRAISCREMEEAYAVRGVLEQLAAELAAPLLGGDVSELRGIQRDLHLAAEAADIMAYAAHNEQFHRTIVERSENRVLLESWQNLGFETRVRILMSKHAEPDLVARAAEHDPVIDALEQQDGIAAGKFLREHADMCSQRWQARMAATQADSSQLADDGHHVPAGILS